ncbi:Rv3235 family protein [Micromonospora sediminicola]|uniref:Rv3235 family protein n=1 Tax=Micromonospora sediminicola TaxID=946078 RepID=UPI0033D015F0
MVDTRRPRSPRPPVRLRPAPPLDPPCTDEDPAWGHTGQLALDLIDRRPGDLGRPAGRAPDHAPGWPRWLTSGALRTTPGEGGTHRSRTSGEGGTHRDTTASGDGVGRPPVGPPPALATATPEAARAAHRFVRTFLEIVNGFRPPGQLRPLCLPEAAARVSAELTRAARRVTPVRRRSARPALHLLRLRICEPRAGAVEATAVFTGTGGTSWAVAVRLEHRRGNWLCLVLDVL